jgi:hypothetical protein
MFGGISKPASWPAALIPGAVAAGNTNVADSTPAQGGAANALVETFDDVEEDGFDVTGIAAAKTRGREHPERRVPSAGVGEDLDVVEDLAA